MDDAEQTTDARAAEALPQTDEDPQHDCQPPQDAEVGMEWTCPECGTAWRLEDAREHPEHLPEQRDQRVNWVRLGKRAPGEAAASS